VCVLCCVLEGSEHTDDGRVRVSNVFGLLVFATDKSRRDDRRWRTSEICTTGNATLMG